jgi:hypothetical protein
MNCEKNIVGNCEVKGTNKHYFNCYQPQCQYEFLTTTADQLPQELWGMFHPDSLITHIIAPMHQIENWAGMGFEDHLDFRLDEHNWEVPTWYLIRNYKWYEKTNFVEPFISKWEDHAERLGY